MPPERLASVYDLKADGSKQKVGKKRGRKPKNKDEIKEDTRPIKRKGPRVKIKSI